MYDEKFPIENNSTTALAIDDVYCLSFVMANCKIHLSKVPTCSGFCACKHPYAPTKLSPCALTYTGPCTYASRSRTRGD